MLSLSIIRHSLGERNRLRTKIPRVFFLGDLLLQKVPLFLPKFLDRVDRLLTPYLGI